MTRRVPTFVLGEKSAETALGDAMAAMMKEYARTGAPIGMAFDCVQENSQTLITPIMAAQVQCSSMGQVSACAGTPVPPAKR